MNICMCGTQASYPHAPDCPYPLFRGSQADQKAWESARQQLRCQVHGDKLYVPESQIDFLVGNMHVWTSYREVVRDFYGRFKRAAATGRVIASKATRKAVYRHALATHRANRQLVIDFRL